MVPRPAPATLHLPAAWHWDPGLAGQRPESPGGPRTAGEADGARHRPVMDAARWHPGYRGHCQGRLSWAGCLEGSGESL